MKGSATLPSDLPLYQVADTPFRIQVDNMFIIDCLFEDNIWIAYIYVVYCTNIMCIIICNQRFLAGKKCSAFLVIKNFYFIQSALSAIALRL